MDISMPLKWVDKRETNGTRPQRDCDVYRL